MFHNARALIFSGGYREKSHHALLVAMRELFADVLEHSLVQGFEDAMHLREEADYGSKFSKSGAMTVVGNAEKLLERALNILG